MTRSASSTACSSSRLVGRDGLDLAVVQLVDLPQASDRQIENGDVGLHAVGHGDGVLAGDSRTDHHDLGGAHSGDAAHQNSASAAVTHQVIGARLRCQASGYFTHRGEEGQ